MDVRVKPAAGMAFVEAMKPAAILPFAGKFPFLHPLSGYLVAL